MGPAFASISPLRDKRHCGTYSRPAHLIGKCFDEVSLEVNTNLGLRLRVLSINPQGSSVPLGSPHSPLIHANGLIEHGDLISGSTVLVIKSWSSAPSPPPLSPSLSVVFSACHTIVCHNSLVSKANYCILLATSKRTKSVESSTSNTHS